MGEGRISYFKFSDVCACVCDCVAGSDVRLPPRGTSWISCKG